MSVIPTGPQHVDAVSCPSGQVGWTGHTCSTSGGCSRRSEPVARASLDVRYVIVFNSRRGYSQVGLLELGGEPERYMSDRRGVGSSGGH
jgi:hypothetical protein